MQQVPPPSLALLLKLELPMAVVADNIKMAPAADRLSQPAIAPGRKLTVSCGRESRKLSANCNEHLPSMY